MIHILVLRNLQKSTEVHNRGWNFEQNGVLELRGDDEVQTRQRELRAERQKDYNSYISQVQAVNVIVVLSFNICGLVDINIRLWCLKIYVC